jgi:chemotaxis protein histidine kinase CheA
MASRFVYACGCASCGDVEYLCEKHKREAKPMSDEARARRKEPRDMTGPELIEALATEVFSGATMKTAQAREVQALLTAWQDAAASDHAHAQRQAERAEQAEAAALRAEQERPLRERISELEGALKLAREAVAHAYRRASLGSDAERLYHAAWQAIDAARRAGREGGELQPLPPNPTCPECHGTGGGTCAGRAGRESDER